MPYGYVHPAPSALPACPLLLSPADGAVEIGELNTGAVAVVFMWGMVAGVTYRFYLDGDLVYTSPDDEPGLQIGELDFSTTYTWEVRSVINGVESSGCEVRTFTTIPEAVVVTWNPDDKSPDEAINDYVSQSVLSGGNLIATLIEIGGGS